MRKIPLGNRKRFAKVDDKDFIRIAEHRWHLSICGAAQRRPWIGKKRGSVFLHQELLGIIGAKRRIIHLDGDRLNCQRKNLKFMGKE